MIKKTIQTLFVLFLFSSSILSQNLSNDTRTLPTKIADLLAQMPATDPVRLDKLMTELSGFGEQGIVDMAGKLVASGKGNDTEVKFALGSFSKFVSLPGKDNARQICIKAYCKAVEKTGEKEIQAFLIAQLQMIANNDVPVPLLKNLLPDDQLCDPSARTLVVINTPASRKALLEAVKTEKGMNQISITEALGDCRNEEAAAVISGLLSTSDWKLKKVALYALGKIGSLSSETILAGEAAKAGYNYEITNSLSSYILWISQTGKAGNTDRAIVACKGLIKNCSDESKVHTKSVALAMLVDFDKKNALSVLVDAGTGAQKEYRAAALQLAGSDISGKATEQWIKKSSKASPEAKADVITMLGKRGDLTALSYLLGSLKDSKANVRCAAILASQNLGHDKALKPILNIISSAGDEELNSAKVALMSMKGDNVVSEVAHAIPAAPSSSKVILLEVLSSRQASSFNGIIFDQTSSSDPVVRFAALKALTHMATEKDLDQLNKLLIATSNSEEVAAIQSSMLFGVRHIAGIENQTAEIGQRMKNGNPAQKWLYYPVLAGIGGKTALGIVSDEYNNGLPDQQALAFEAITHWSDETAISKLIDICKSENKEYSNKAMMTYIGLVSKSKFPADQKLLLLRNAMDVAKETDQQKRILNEIGNLATLQSFVFAGSFINNPSVQQESANAVMRIALSNKSLYGEMVTELLNKAIQTLSGPESEYQKESIRKHLAALPTEPGFVSMFNGKDLTGWKGLVENPVARSKMTPKQLAEAQKKADEAMNGGWKVKDNKLVFEAKGDNLCTQDQYGDFEMGVDWKITKDGDAGIYLRGSPQVQIWDTARSQVGAQVGSGGLYNNTMNMRNPLKVADNPVGEWNSFHIIMKGERVTVYLNGELVVDNVILENYWDRSIPIFSTEQIELQAHGTLVEYRDLYIRKISRPEPYVLSEAEQKEGYRALFDGLSMFNFTGNTTDYIVENGAIAIYPRNGDHGNLYTKDEFSDFTYRFDFQLTPGANNGIGIRAPLKGDAAYVGMEIQVLDNEAGIYKDLQPYQYHGSVYGIIPAKRGFLKPVGEWNSEEITAIGPNIKVVLNGETILEGNIKEASKNGTADHKDHPGLLNKSGHIGFLGHGDVVKFKNIRIKDLAKSK